MYVPIYGVIDVQSVEIILYVLHYIIINLSSRAFTTRRVTDMAHVRITSIGRSYVSLCSNRFRTVQRLTIVRFDTNATENLRRSSGERKEEKLYS